MRDLFDRIIENKGPLGKWAEYAEGYFVDKKAALEWADNMVDYFNSE